MLTDNNKKNLLDWIQPEIEVYHFLNSNNTGRERALEILEKYSNGLQSYLPNIIFSGAGYMMYQFLNLIEERGIKDAVWNNIFSTYIYNKITETFV